MNLASLSQNTDMDSLLTHLQREAAQGDQEGIQASMTGIRSHAEKIRDKRQEQLDNINQQLKKAGGNGCITVLKSVFKVFDLLLKPLSALTGGQLKLELGKALEFLQKAKDSGRLAGLQIDEKEMSQAIAGIKRLLQDDMSQMKNLQQEQHEQNQKVLQILNSLQDSFRNTTNM